MLGDQKLGGGTFLAVPSGNYATPNPAHQLASKDWDLVDDGEPHPPLLILCKVDHGWQEGLAQPFDANDFVDCVKLKRKEHSLVQCLG